MVDVGSATELKQIISAWRAAVPPRLERRGKQRLLERWVLAALLDAELEAGLLSFPITVVEGENPDFEVSMGAQRRGIEATEAVAPDEQARWTQWEREEANDDGPRVRSIDPADLSGDRYVGFVHERLSVKSVSCSARCTELLVYLNTRDDWFDTVDEKLRKLSHLSEKFSRFGKIWIVTDGDVLELRERRVIKNVEHR